MAAIRAPSGASQVLFLSEVSLFKTSWLKFMKTQDRGIYHGNPGTKWSACGCASEHLSLQSLKPCCLEMFVMELSEAAQDRGVYHHDDPGGKWSLAGGREPKRSGSLLNALSMSRLISTAASCAHWKNVEFCLKVL